MYIGIWLSSAPTHLMRSTWAKRARPSMSGNGSMKTVSAPPTQRKTANGLWFRRAWRTQNSSDAVAPRAASAVAQFSMWSGMA